MPSAATLFKLALPAACTRTILAIRRVLLLRPFSSPASVDILFRLKPVEQRVYFAFVHATRFSGTTADILVLPLLLPKVAVPGATGSIFGRVVDVAFLVEAHLVPRYYSLVKLFRHWV